ncbi:MAG: alpha/beta fold hydrolase [Pseudomonadota bacterium]
MPLIQADGAQLYYDTVGEGEPIVLIPGLGTTGAFFAGIAPALASEYQVIRVDLRGVGQSSKPKQAYSMELWADDVARVLDHLEIGSAHVLGSSLGGCVALAFADRYLPRTRSLVLAATFSEIDRLLELNYRVRIDLIETIGMTRLLADFATTALFGRTFFETPQGRAAAANVLAAIQQNEQDIYLEHLRAVLRFGRCEPGQEAEPKFTARLPAITRPALVMCGEEDVLTVPKFSRILAAQLPDARLLVQERCGHVNLVEQPQESAAAILAFLRAVPR